jgi:hypothetical protein
MISINERSTPVSAVGRVLSRSQWCFLDVGQLSVWTDPYCRLQKTSTDSSIRDRAPLILLVFKRAAPHTCDRLYRRRNPSPSLSVAPKQSSLRAERPGSANVNRRSTVARP